MIIMLWFKVEVPRKQTNSLSVGIDLAAAMPPGQFRMILSFKRQAASGKLQATSLTINKYRIL